MAKQNSRFDYSVRHEAGEPWMLPTATLPNPTHQLQRRLIEQLAVPAGTVELPRALLAYNVDRAMSGMSRMAGPILMGAMLGTLARLMFG